LLLGCTVVGLPGGVLGDPVIGVLGATVGELGTTVGVALGVVVAGVGVLEVGVGVLGVAALPGVSARFGDGVGSSV
jgi:hypothetical protein